MQGAWVSFLVKELRSHMPHRDRVDCSLPGSFVYEVLQARILERVACPSPGDLPNPGVKPQSSALQAASLPSEPAGKPYFYLFAMLFQVFQSQKEGNKTLAIVLSLRGEQSTARSLHSQPLGVYSSPSVVAGNPLYVV